MLTAQTADKINRFNPTAEEVQLGSEILATQTGQVFNYFLDLSATAFNTAAKTIFTAPFAMRIIRVNALAMATGSYTVTFDNGTTAIAEVACAVDGTLTSAGAAVAAKATMVLAEGDTVTVQASDAAVRGIMSVDCVRL